MVATPGPPPARLRFTNRTVASTIVIVVGALWATDLLGRAGRVLGWLLVAAIAASLLHPAVSALTAAPESASAAARRRESRR